MTNRDDWTGDWQGAKNVLAVRLDALGDVLMTTPALAALKQSRTDRRVTLLTSSAGDAIAPLLPMLDGALVHDVPWMKATPPRPDGSAERALVERLRQARFDAAVIFTVFSQSPLPAALLCVLADIPLRLAHARENPYQLLTHWVPEPEPQQFVRHEAQRQLDLVAAVGCVPTDPRLAVRVRPRVRRQMRERLATLGLRLDEPWIAVHPGASAPSRRYPPELFAAAVRMLVDELGYQVVFTGSASEHVLVEQIRAAAGVASFSLAGETTLEELAAVLAEAPLLISNNTGPVHLAAAVGTPVVDLYALTNPQHAPWQVPHELLFHEVPCRNCYKSVCPEGHHDCLRGVTPETVVAAACRLLEHEARPLVATTENARPLVAAMQGASDVHARN
jgi:lipopolysaccharide heptosyltransferase II